jgi:flagellar FliL protein
LVIVELVAASMMLPSAAQTEELARELATARKGEDAHAEEKLHDGEGHGEHHEKAVEVKLGEYKVTRFTPPDKTMNIDIEVYGIVLEEEEKEFEHEFKATKNRIEEQIVMTMHAAEAADLGAPGLGLLKRQILEKTNRALGRPLLREVVFTRINFVER